jgi:hypothetical protein
LERWGVVVAEDVAGVLTAAAIAGELDDGETGGFGTAGGKDGALVPLKAPERSSNPVEPGIDGDMFHEVGAHGFILMAKESDGGSVAERFHSFVGSLIEMAVISGRRKFRVGFLVTEQDAIAV